MPQTVDLAYLSIAEASALLRRREFSPVELVNALLERSERLQETLVPYVTLTPDLARQQARSAEFDLLRGESASPLLGIPIAYKDIVMTEGIRTTCGPALHADWRPTYDASLADTWMRQPGITSLFNLTGQPAVAFPTGFSTQALPLSAQLVGRPFDEATVLRAVHPASIQAGACWSRRASCR